VASPELKVARRENLKLRRRCRVEARILVSQTKEDKKKRCVKYVLMRNK
jgi:hypothetical protein